MRTLPLKYGMAAVLAAVLWFVAWYVLLAPDVARVEASIDYQDRQFKSANRFITFKAESVRRSGFPFHFRVRVNRPALTMISGPETYGISASSITLEPVNADEGRYRVMLPPVIDAVYAHDGELPQQYHATLSPLPQLALRATGDSNACSPFPGGKPCAAVAADAPLVSYALGLPGRLVVHVVRGADARDIGFDGVALTVPVFMSIPTNIGNTLEIAVNVLREAFERQPTAQ